MYYDCKHLGLAQQIQMVYVLVSEYIIFDPHIQMVYALLLNYHYIDLTDRWTLNKYGS